jgi:hypothetical protein
MLFEYFIISVALQRQNDKLTRVSMKTPFRTDKKELNIIAIFVVDNEDNYILLKPNMLISQVFNVHGSSVK